jgi:hypothetical protein
MLAEPHVQVLARELKARIEREVDRPAPAPPRSRG